MPCPCSLPLAQLSQKRCRAANPPLVRADASRYGGPFVAPCKDLARPAAADGVFMWFLAPNFFFLSSSTRTKGVNAGNETLRHDGSGILVLLKFRHWRRRRNMMFRSRICHNSSDRRLIVPRRETSPPLGGGGKKSRPVGSSWYVWGAQPSKPRNGR